MRLLSSPLFSKLYDMTEKYNKRKLICVRVFATIYLREFIERNCEMVFSSESATSEVQERSAVKGVDFQKMFEEMEATGSVTLDIPNPYAEGDASLLEWLKDGFTE